MQVILGYAMLKLLQQGIDMNPSKRHSHFT